MRRVEGSKAIFHRGKVKVTLLNSNLKLKYKAISTKILPVEKASNPESIEYKINSEEGNKLPN